MNVCIYNSVSLLNGMKSVNVNIKYFNSTPTLYLDYYPVIFESRIKLLSITGHKGQRSFNSCDFQSNWHNSSRLWRVNQSNIFGVTFLQKFIMLWYAYANFQLYAAPIHTYKQIYFDRMFGWMNWQFYWKLLQIFKFVEKLHPKVLLILISSSLSYPSTELFLEWISKVKENKNLSLLIGRS